jgi:hypothetical protein
VIVGYLNVVSISASPEEANPPLIVNPYAVLPFSVAVQRFQSVSWWGRQISQFSGAVHLPKLPTSNLLNALKTPASLALVQSLSFSTTERLDHKVKFYPALRLTSNRKQRSA